MTIPDALASFQTGLKNLMTAVQGNSRCRDILGEMLATLSLPANRAKIIAGDKLAIANLFTFVDGYAKQFMEIDNAPANPPLAAAPPAANSQPHRG